MKGGLNLASVLERDDEYKYSDDYLPKVGFHAGITADIHLQDMFYLETGVLFEQKGFRYHFKMMGLEIESLTVMYYLDLPVNLKMRYRVEDDLYAVVTLGPYLGSGLWGNYTETFDFGGITDYETDIKWGNDEENDAVKRLDYGLGVSVGVEYAGLIAGLSLDLGIRNLSPYTDSGDKLKNRAVRLSAGYIFKYKKEH
jgi:hypothetical protein